MKNKLIILYNLTVLILSIIIMFLSEYIKSINSEVNINNFIDYEINKVETDSRNITKNDIFFAIKTFNSDGILYVEKAIDNGAIVIVCDENSNYKTYNKNIVVITCKDTTKLLSEFLNILYNQRPKHIIGITGTCGKTSTAEFTRQLIQGLGISSASIGTLGIKFSNSHLKEDTLTMRETVDLYKKLNFLKAEKNIDYVAMEMTSQGMDQRRSEGIDVEIGVFLNLLDHEHLDYHKNLDNYLEAKMILFRDILKNGSPVVLNADIEEFEKIKRVCLEKNHKILTFGYNGDIKILDIIDTEKGLTVKIEYKGINYKLETNVIFKFQIYNMLASLGILIQLGFDKDVNKLINLLSCIKQADGRGEYVNSIKNGARIFIDYAHTPDSFEKVLSVVKNHLNANKKGRLITLFGSGGDRDSSKRPLMGEIARKYSDVVIVTEDNPRTEDPKNIEKDILKGCPDALCIHDRAEAIRKGIDMLKEGDILMLLGKGHERYQIIGKKTIYFNEVEVVNDYINK